MRMWTAKYKFKIRYDHWRWILYIVIYTIPNEIVWQFQGFLINHEIWSLNHDTTAQTVNLTVRPWELEGLSWSRASHLLANFFPVTSYSPRSLSLRAGFSGWSSSGEGKVGKLATTSLEFEICLIMWWFTY